MNYKKIKPKQENILNSIIFKCKDYKKSSLLYDEVKSIAQGVYAARDLVWQPPNILFPLSFADECIKLRDIGVKVTVYDESQLKIQAYTFFQSTTKHQLKPAYPPHLYSIPL